MQSVVNVISILDDMIDIVDAYQVNLIKKILLFVKRTVV